MRAERLPESVEGGEVSSFLAELMTYRDRAIVLAMVLGGLWAGEARSLRHADLDTGLGRMRVVGKGGRERIVPIERAFFVECAAVLAPIPSRLLELKAFQRVTLAPGETVQLTFGLPTGMMGFHGRDLTYIVEPGRIELFLGTSSGAAEPVGEVVLTSETDRAVPVIKCYLPKVEVMPITV